MIGRALIVFIAVQHVAFAALEILFWQKPLGLKVFAQSREQAAATAVMATNQGVYNLFLSAGLIASLWWRDSAFQAFFVACVLVAGVVGGLSAKRTILFVQGGPAVVTFLALFLGW